MKIVITSGGTQEKIDNVRNITNSSSGKLGYKIANEFFKKDKNTKIIYIHSKKAIPFMPENKNVKNIEITNTEDLENTVKKILLEENIDIFVHSMAVSDYTTDFMYDFEKLKKMIVSHNRGVSNELFEQFVNICKIDTSKKVSSNILQPSIVLRGTSKIINIIKKLSPYTFLIGFKLLDNVKEDELFNVGFDLLRKNRCNLVLANDISEIRKGNHEGMLIYPEKSYDKIYGKDEIAKTLVEKVYERYFVKHPKSICVSEDNKIDNQTLKEFQDIGRRLDKHNFLPRVINHDRPEKNGTYGNISKKDKDCFFITSRNVNKSNLMKYDISRIDSVNFIQNESVYAEVYYNSQLKPSIDTSIHSAIYKQTNYNYIIHIHTNKVFLGVPYIDKMFPCGCDKECNAIIEKIKENPESKVIQLKKHGLISLGNSFSECYDNIKELFLNTPYIDYDTNIIDEDSIQHINETNPDFLNKKFIFPLKINKMNIGILYEEETKDNIHFALYTLPVVQGKHLNIVKKYLSLSKKNHILHTTEKCNIANFYMTKYNFKLLNADNKQNIMCSEN